MPLKLADLGAFVCSWNDKSTMLRQIASELNIDISSLVFIDDNPAECELVRRELPEVAVIGLTGDPATFRRRVDEAGLFGISEERSGGKEWVSTCRSRWLPSQ